MVPCKWDKLQSAGRLIHRSQISKGTEMPYPSVSAKYEQMLSGLRKCIRDGRSMTVVPPWVLNYTRLNPDVKTFLMGG